jgi:replicative DNA helicase
MTKALPHDVKLERYVLGSIMISKQNEVYKLTEDDFYNNTAKIIFRAIHKLFINKRNIDIVTVPNLIKNEIEDADIRIAELVSEITTPAGFDSAVKTLKTYNLRRQIIERTYLLNELAESEIEDIMDLKSEALAIMELNITEDKKRNSLADNFNNMMQDLEKQRDNKDSNKLYTGFPDLDRILAGFHPEELTILAARPGKGKTAFAIQLMIELAHKGNYCYFISREMSELQLTKRITANMAQINGDKFRLAKNLSSQELKQLEEMREYITALPIDIDDKTETVQEIRSKCWELHHNNKLDILIIDYLQLLNSSGQHSSRREQVESISRNLKQISMEFNIPVIALSQLSRASIDNQEPQLHHLRESGSLEQDADNVIFLHVPEDAEQTLKVIIAKQRNGGTGTVNLNLDKSTLKFTSQSRR